MEIMQIEDFSPKKGDIFKLVISDDHQLDIVLSDITSRKTRDFPGKIRDPFSLFFDGAKGVLCPQGTYRFRHGDDWEKEIFIVPIGQNDDGTYRYQAVFN